MGVGQVRLILALMLLIGSGAWALPGAPHNAEGLCQRNAGSLFFDGMQPTLLVVLSPRMPLALKEWGRMRVVAQQEGLRVVVVRDPQVSDNEWQGAVAKLGVDDLQTVGEMAQALAADCGLLNHTPAALIGRCGAVHPWPILGVMPSNSWSVLLRARVDQLSEVACK